MLGASTTAHAHACIIAEQRQLKHYSSMTPLYSEHSANFWIQNENVQRGGESRVKKRQAPPAAQGRQVKQ